MSIALLIWECVIPLLLYMEESGNSLQMWQSIPQWMIHTGFLQRQLGMKKTTTILDSLITTLKKFSFLLMTHDRLKQKTSQGNSSSNSSNNSNSNDDPHAQADTNHFRSFAYLVCQHYLVTVHKKEEIEEKVLTLGSCWVSLNTFFSRLLTLRLSLLITLTFKESMLLWILVWNAWFVAKNVHITAKSAPPVIR